MHAREQISSAISYKTEILFLDFTAYLSEMKIFKLFHCFALLIFFGIGVHCELPCACSGTISSTYLDIASDMIRKTKLNMATCSEDCKTNHSTFRPVDCSEVLHLGLNESGLYTIWPRSRINEDKPIAVYCDMETEGGGWTVIQRRGNFGRAEDYFFRDWESYKEGFGDREKDFWLGNDNIFALTTQRLYSVRFDLQDFEQNKQYEQYDTFWIDDEFNNYTLHIGGYSGDTGDSMVYHNSQKFSTKDRDNDSDKSRHCAEIYKGGWWYRACYRTNLNGPYLRGKHEKGLGGIHWSSWKGLEESLESTKIMVKPKKFRKTDFE